MKRYLAYIRVSTVRQGEKGSSLQEQKASIEAYASRNHLQIAEWFEETETAAKRGRPIFTKMLKALDRGLAAGVITHKIDRSARNLKDWADLGELLDRGIEMHFAHESIDLSSRGGRLSADIQAVVAADYIRNLRDEVRKGFYGRLKQGLYPIRAPLGYLDQGRGLPKEIDSARAPIIAKAFELYAGGCWSLDSIGQELYERGLRGRTGNRVTKNCLSVIFNNPFYIGLIRIRKTGEIFQGVHAPLIDKPLFDRVQSILRGRLTHKANVYRFRYQKMIRCASCDHSLVAEHQKGYIYYRCHTSACPITCVREDQVDEALRGDRTRLHFGSDLEQMVWRDAERASATWKANMAQEIQSISLAIAACEGRLGRLTDAYVDRVIDKESYLARKEQLLGERATHSAKKASLAEGDAGFRLRVKKILERLKRLQNMPDLPNDDDIRDLLKDATSNLTVSEKKLVVAWRNPFSELLNYARVTVGEPHRDKPRTGRVRAKKIARIIVEHCSRELDPDA